MFLPIEKVRGTKEKEKKTIGTRVKEFDQNSLFSPLIALFSTTNGPILRT